MEKKPTSSTTEQSQDINSSSQDQNYNNSYQNLNLNKAGKSSISEHLDQEVLNKFNYLENLIKVENMKHSNEMSILLDQMNNQRAQYQNEMKRQSNISLFLQRKLEEQKLLTQKQMEDQKSFFLKQMEDQNSFFLKQMEEQKIKNEKEIQSLKHENKLNIIKLENQIEKKFKDVDKVIQELFEKYSFLESELILIKSNNNNIRNT